MTKYTASYTAQFKKDAKRAEKQGKNMQLMREMIALLTSGEPVPPQHKDHALTGNFNGYREC
ncbi:MAG: type II toxin-antitoxin system YafQ family toxin, partial [Cloacibacillus sp.]